MHPSNTSAKRIQFHCSLMTYRAIRLLPHHNNVQTTTVVVVVIHTPHSIPKNDHTRTDFCTSKYTVQMITLLQKNFKKFFFIFHIFKKIFGGK